jgi:hypothetical protein
MADKIPETIAREMIRRIKDGGMCESVLDLAKQVSGYSVGLGIVRDELNAHDEMFDRLTGMFARHGVAEPAEGFKKAWQWIHSCVRDMGKQLDAANAKLKAGVAYGPEAFRFVTFMSWVNMASSWFEFFGLTGKTAVCLDAKGRICRLGRDFMQARDENAFPVTVHPYRPTEPTEKPAERPTSDPIENSTPQTAGPS